MLRPAVSKGIEVVFTVITNMLTQFFTSPQSQLWVISVAVGGIYRAQEVNYGIGAVVVDERKKIPEFSLSFGLSPVVSEVWEADACPTNI